MVKGFKYFKKNGGSLKKLVFRNCSYMYADKFNSCIKECPDLEALHVQSSTIDVETAKHIGKILSDYKNVR